MSYLSGALFSTVHNLDWGEYSKTSPSLKNYGPFLSEPLWQKRKRVLNKVDRLPHASSILPYSPAKPLSLTAGDGDADGLFKWGLYYVSKYPGNKDIGIHPEKIERRTQRLIHTTNYKPVSESMRLSFEMSSCKTFAGMILSSDNLTNSSCLWIQHLWWCYQVLR